MPRPAEGMAGRGNEDKDERITICCQHKYLFRDLGSIHS